MDEPKPPKPREAHAYNWLAIRRDHAQGMSVSAIARKYKLRRQTIQDRAKSERWADRNGQLAAEATSIAISKAADQVAETVAEGLIEGLIRHAEIETLLLDVAKLALTKATTCDFKMVGDGKTTDVEAMERAVNAASKAIDKSREIHGLRSGDKSVSAGDDTKAGKVYEVAVEEEKSA